MAITNSTQADNATNKLAGASLEMLVTLFEKQTTKIFEDLHIIECVASGGKSRANSLDLDGDPIDSISGGMFSSIINAATNMSAHNELRDTISELRRIAAQQPALV